MQQSPGFARYEAMGMEESSSSSKRGKPLEIASVIAADAVPQDQVLCPLWNPERISLHETESADCLSQCSGREQRCTSRFDAELLECGHRLRNIRRWRSIPRAPLLMSQTSGSTSGPDRPTWEDCQSRIMEGRDLYDGNVQSFSSTNLMLLPQG